MFENKNAWLLESTQTTLIKLYWGWALTYSLNWMLEGLGSEKRYIRIKLLSLLHAQLYTFIDTWVHTVERSCWLSFFLYDKPIKYLLVLIQGSIRILNVPTVHITYIHRRKKYKINFSIFTYPDSRYNEISLVLEITYILYTYKYAYALYALRVLLLISLICFPLLNIWFNWETNEHLNLFCKILHFNFIIL